MLLATVQNIERSLLSTAASGWKQIIGQAPYLLLSDLVNQLLTSIKQRSLVSSNLQTAVTVSVLHNQHRCNLQEAQKERLLIELQDVCSRKFKVNFNKNKQKLLLEITLSTFFIKTQKLITFQKLVYYLKI